MVGQKIPYIRAGKVVGWCVCVKAIGPDDPAGVWVWVEA